MKRMQTHAQNLAVTSGLAILLLAAGCGGAKPKPEVAGNNATGAQQSNASGVEAMNDSTKLDAEIERLEKQAERNPADQSARVELARAYVLRGDFMRGSNRLREALLDYQRALRLDPDNEAAQRNAASTKDQIGGGEQEDENGAPAPLPITPNVADDEAKPTPTPKKQ